MVGLIGRTVPGKTSVIDAVSGFADYTGRGRYRACPRRFARPTSGSAPGWYRTFQTIELCDDLSVAENVRVSLASVRGSRAATPSRDSMRSWRCSVCAHIGTGLLRTCRKERQLVSIARALASNPAILLLDEPAGGLDTTESARLGQRLVQVRDAGVGIVIVDHDMDPIFGACDYVYVVDPEGHRRGHT